MQQGRPLLRPSVVAGSPVPFYHLSTAPWSGRSGAIRRPRERDFDHNRRPDIGRASLRSGSTILCQIFQPFLDTALQQHKWHRRFRCNADPSNTLYLVFDEGELPDKIVEQDDDGNFVEISKEDIINIKDSFVNDIYEKIEDDWPFQELDKLSVEGNKIVDIKIVG